MHSSSRRLVALLSMPALLVARVDAQLTPQRMPRTPDIHGDSLVFSAEGDLWLGSISGGTAHRITTDDGLEIDPRFSPDGRQIAFTGQYDGGTDVYVMPVDGGAPRRLTYDPVGAEMVAWTPDGSHILFRSRRSVPMQGFRLYLVSATGGLPTPLPMERAAQGSYSPDGKRLAYCVRVPSANNWKRYHGGQANHVWIEELASKQFRRIDQDDVNEQCPVWVGGALYYLSERNGTANLWRLDPNTGRSTRMTSHQTYDVKTPATDGERIVYAWGNSLWLYDARTSVERELRFTIETDRLHARSHTIPGSLSDFSLGPTGKRLVVEGRGQLATIPAEKGEVRVIAAAPGTRGRQPLWSPDGRQIVFISDRSGEENLWLAAASGEGQAKQLTRDARVHLHSPVWSPDGKYIAYWDDSLALWLVDAATGVKTLVVRSEYGPVSEYSFSPDGKWLAYAAAVSLTTSSIYLYEIARSQSTRITLAPTRDSHPVFDPEGKYLFFVGQRRIDPKFDAIDFQMDIQNASGLYLIGLAADTAIPSPVASDEEGPVPSSKETHDTAKPATGPTAAPVLPAVKVDLAGIADRIAELPVPPGDYTDLGALPGKLLYVAQGQGDARKLKALDLKTGKETELASGVMGYSVSLDCKKMALRTAEGLQILDVGVQPAAGAAKVDLGDWRVTVDPEQEWKQIFEEAWRNHRDVFYDPKLHGQDWQAVHDKYAALLPGVGSRADLNAIIADMQGEMNVSHEFVGGGYDRRQAQTLPGNGYLGAELSLDPAARAYRISRLFAGDGFEAEARSPLLAPGLGVHEGDYLIAIGGQPLKPDQDPNALLIGKGGKTIALTISSKPTGNGSRTVRIKALASETRARYYDWVSRNREYVRQRGGERLAYIHVPNMQEFGMAELSKHYNASLDKDGLILDVRYNGGGITSGMILERLSRVIFEYDQGRYGAPMPYHPTAFPGRVVVICNDGTGSDGEYFCTGFRAMKLGATIGTRTWGGFMAVNGVEAIDGGTYSTPVDGSFTPEGKWLPDGYGFNPDYVVPDDPNAFVVGRDPQLDKAIEVLQDEIRRDPPRWPRRLEPPSAEKALGPNKR